MAGDKRKMSEKGLLTPENVFPQVQAVYPDTVPIERTELNAWDNAMKRTMRAAVAPVTALSLMLEWQRDWAAEDTYDAVMDIVQTHCGAYGAAVEYVYTMVHGAPPRRSPAYEVPKAGVPKSIECARKRAVGA